MKTKYSAIYRIMHWVIALVFLLLLITIFLRLTWMNKNNMADIMQNYLNGINKPLPREEIVAMAKKIRSPMWDWHIYFGYILVGLFGIRFLLPPFGFMKFQNPFKKDLSAKMRFKKWTYIIFYLCVAVSLTTGLMMVFGPESLEKPMENIHVLGIYYLVAFIVIHLAGVLIAEFTNQKGIISAIVRGSSTHKEE